MLWSRLAALCCSSYSSEVVKADNWCPAGVGYGDMTKCVSGDPFTKMRGYDFRIFPHLTADAKHEPGQVPCRCALVATRPSGAFHS
jgi:hypothetical protein